MSLVSTTKDDFNPLRLHYFLLLAVAIVLVYAAGSSNPFHYDDLHSIRDNPHIRSLKNIPAFFTHPEYFTADPRSAMYRPIVLVSYALNYALDKSEVRSYHWVNIAVHAINSGLVLLLTQILLRRGIVALLAASIFALHPVNSEVVNYISSRSESLCALFFLVSFIAYIQARSAIEWRAAKYGISLGGFIAALLCKSIAVTLLPVLLAFEICFPVRVPSIRAVLARLGPFLALVLLYVVAIQHMLKTALVDAPVRPMSVQWATQIKALVYYAKLLCYPWALNIEHQFALGGAEFAVWISAGCMLCFFVWAWFRGPSARFLIAWSLLVLAPTLVVPLNILINEHRLYLVSIAFSIGLAYLVEDLLQRRAAHKVGAICCISLVLIFSSLGVQRTLTWGSAETLWAAALKDAPHMPRPHLYMGNVHREAGQNQRALNSYARALVVHPEILSGGDLVSIYNNIGATYLAMERFEQAAAAYEKVLALDPEYEKARASLEAIVALRQEAGQKEAKDWQRRGLVALIRGDLPQAVILLNESLARQPLPSTYMALAQAYERLEDLGAALVTYRTLLDSNPAGPSADQARLRIEELSRRATGGGGKP